MAGQVGGLIGNLITISTQASETHTINSSANITLNANTKVASALIIGGGGGGMDVTSDHNTRASGGGGAGGYRTVTVTGLTEGGTYPAVIGGGGATKSQGVASSIFGQSSSGG